MIGIMLMCTNYVYEHVYVYVHAACLFVCCVLMFMYAVCLYTRYAYVHVNAGLRGGGDNFYIQKSGMH